MKSEIATKRKNKQTICIINNKKFDNDLQLQMNLNYFVSVGQILAAKLAQVSLNPIDFLQPNPHSVGRKLVYLSHVAGMEQCGTVYAQVEQGSPDRL